MHQTICNWWKSWDHQRQVMQSLSALRHWYNAQKYLQNLAIEGAWRCFDHRLNCKGKRELWKIKKQHICLVWIWSVLSKKVLAWLLSSLQDLIALPSLRGCCVQWFQLKLSTIISSELSWWQPTGWSLQQFWISIDSNFVNETVGDKNFEFQQVTLFPWLVLTSQL